MDCFCSKEARLMHRFFVESAESGSLLTLSPEDARHAVKVLRLREGDRIEAVEAETPWIAEITEINADHVFLRKTEPLPSSEPALRFTLYQGLPKSDKMDWIVQKAVELGVSRVIPVLLTRSVSRPDPKEATRKTARWQKIAGEAGKQSGRCVIPVVEEPLTLPRLLGRMDLPSVNAVPWEEASGFGPLAFRKRFPALTDVGVMIGPEGGITPEEIVMMEEAKFVTLTLGPRILRTETAGLAALASLMSLYGEMEKS